MSNSQNFKRKSVKELPPEFFLPPPTNAELCEETGKLIAGCYAFILILGIIVVFTQGIVIEM
jgi:hypothetical protein